MPHAKSRLPALAATTILGTCLLAATALPIFNVNTERAIVVHYPNGDKAVEVTAKNNKWDGDFVAYEINSGLVKAKGSYKNGKKEGSWMTWDVADGNSFVETEGAFIAGDEEGQWTYFHRFMTQKKSEQGRMQKGARIGIWKEWWPNGKQKTEGAYDEEEERTGHWKVWTEDGEIDTEETGKYESGSRVD